jgi:hypothetical protein
MGRLALSTASKITLVAVATVLVSSACGAGSETVGVSGAAAASSSSPAPGSNLQDMRDLYALKKQVAALRREQSPVSGGGCGVRDL